MEIYALYLILVWTKLLIWGSKSGNMGNKYILGFFVGGFLAATGGLGILEAFKLG